MTNLLPQEQQKLLQKEYTLRRGIVVLGFLTALLIFATILLAPSYILVAYRAGIGSIIPAAASNQQSERAALAAQVVSDNTVLSALTPDASSTPMSANILRIITDASSNITVTSIDYEPNTAGPFSITVGGTAASRESLLGFIETLRAEPAFASVDLPISNFASDSNINFSFVITGKNI